MTDSAQIAVPAGTTPVALIPAGTDSTAGNTIALFNPGTVTVGLGGAGVTAASMFRALAPGATLVIDLASADVLFGLVPTGTTAGAVDVLRVK